MHYLKIINTFKIIHAFYCKLSKELKMDQAVLELWIKTLFWLFDPQLINRLAY